MSSPPPKKKLRSSDKCSIIGSVNHQIVGAKLPSNRQVLSVLLFNTSRLKNKHKAAILAIQEVTIFWEKARIPTSVEKYCVEKLESLHKTYKYRIKHVARTPTEKEKHFDDTLDDLFDIAAINAEKTMANEEKQFLIVQRKKGREGILLGIDRKGEKREELKQDRIEKERKRKAKSDAEKQMYETGEKIQLKMVKNSNVMM